MDFSLINMNLLIGNYFSIPDWVLQKYRDITALSAHGCVKNADKMIKQK